MDLLNTLVAENYIQNSTVGLNLILSISMSFIGGCIILLVHRITSTNMVYDPQINFSLLLITMIVTVVMMVIGSNLALSLGLIGALSIIRFRTAIKNTIDISFIFWSIATGLALGSYSYFLAVIEILAISIILILASKFFLLNKKNGEYIIVMHLDPNIESTKNVDIEISKIAQKFEVKSYVQLDGYSEYSLFASINESQINELMHKLQLINEVSSISILNPNTNLYI